MSASISSFVQNELASAKDDDTDEEWVIERLYATAPKRICRSRVEKCRCSCRTRAPNNFGISLFANVLYLFLSRILANFAHTPNIIAHYCCYAMSTRNTSKIGDDMLLYWCANDTIFIVFFMQRIQFDGEWKLFSSRTSEHKERHGMSAFCTLSVACVPCDWFACVCVSETMAHGDIVRWSSGALQSQFNVRIAWTCFWFARRFILVKFAQLFLTSFLSEVWKKIRQIVWRKYVHRKTRKRNIHFPVGKFRSSNANEVKIAEFLCWILCK